MIYKNAAANSGNVASMNNKKDDTVKKRVAKKLIKKLDEISSSLDSLNNRWKREKRSADKNSGYVRKFYRHPKLSYEEELSQLNATLRAEGTNLNYTTNDPVDAKTPLKKSHNYKPVFPNCDDTEDSRRNLSLGNRTEGKDKPESSVQQRRNESYINIQDHQKNVENTTSSGISDYDPNKIPYVEVPDYSDIREESLDERDRQASKNKTQGDTEFVDPTDSREVKSSERSRNGSVESKRSNVSEVEADGGPESNEMSSKLNNSDLGEPGGSEESRDDSEETQGDSKSRSGPIIFDINEYRKPFDLDEFLKDDPIMKKLAPLEKETRTKYGKNGKRVSAGFNEPESDNTFRERARDTFDDLPKYHRSTDFADVFADVADDTQRGDKDKDFLSFKGKGTFENEFLPRYFTGDVIKDRRKKNRNLNKKSVSRLNEDIEKDVPGDYGSLWYSEYKSPSRRVDMEAEERRK